MNRNFLSPGPRHARSRWALAAAACIAGAFALRICAADDAAVDAAAAPVKPIPSMTAEHADSGLLLGVVDSGKQLVAVGGYGDIILSGDGNHWTQVPTPIDVTLTGVAFADDQHGWAVGHDAVILHTADGGRSWVIQNYQPELNSPLFAVLALDPQKALAVGAFGLLKVTEDAGAHWTDVDAPEVVSDKLHLNAVARLANGDLFIAGEHGLAAVSADGRKWQRLTAPYEGSFFGAMAWGKSGVIAYGLRGNVLVNDDARTGAWRKIDAHTTSSFFGGLALPDGVVALVGSDGTVVKIDQAGTAQVLLDSSQQKGQASSFAGGAAYKNELVVVGESGVQQVSLK